MSLPAPQKGQLLIAELALTGNIPFSRSVVFLAEHNQEGSVGFILNKKTDYKLSDLLADIKGDFPLYKGGPVDQDNLYYLHNTPDLLPKSVEIADGIFWGGDFTILHRELKKGSIPADKIRFFLGYSGWMPQQLDDEINADSWIICDNEFDVFPQKNSPTWKEKLEKLGGEYLIWANSPENPNYN